MRLSTSLLEARDGGATSQLGEGGHFVFVFAGARDEILLLHYDVDEAFLGLLRDRVRIVLDWVDRHMLP